MIRFGIRSGAATDAQHAAAAKIMAMGWRR